MSPNNSSPSPELEKLIEAARKDLANRLTIPVNEITIMEAQDVTWSDSSLGCPNPSLMYMQVLTPGYLIRLGAQNQMFEYHTNKTGNMIFCPNPSPPLPGEVQSK